MVWPRERQEAKRSLVKMRPISRVARCPGTAWLCFQCDLVFVVWQWDIVNNNSFFMGIHLEHSRLVLSLTPVHTGNIDFNNKTKHNPDLKHLPRAWVANAAMALCSRSGLTASTSNSWVEQREKDKHRRKETTDIR